MLSDAESRRQGARIAARRERQEAELKALLRGEAPEPQAQPNGGKVHSLQEVPGAVAVPAGRHVVLTPARSIRSERLQWLWPNRVPLRGQTVVAGEKGLGKSVLTNAWLPAAVTNGTLEGHLHGQPADVAVITAEDDWRAVVKPRLVLAGADLARVHRITVEDDAGRGLFALPHDVALIEDALDGLDRRVRLLVVDPIGAFLTESTNTNLDAPVRRALYPLADLADARDMAVCVVMHLTKDDTKRLVQRVSGSGAFVNAARSVLALVRDPGDPKGEQGSERVLVQTATNWGVFAPSLSLTMEGQQVETDDGQSTSVVRVVENGETDVDLDELQVGRDGGTDASDCEQEIIAALKAGERPSREVKTAVAKELGCHRRTVERAAKRMSDHGELVIEDVGFPRTTIWSLATREEGASQ